MRYRKLSLLGDYTFGNGQLNFYRDVPDAVAQAVKTRLLLWLGEWFLNLEEGTPYMQGILGKYSKEVADTTIQERVLDTQGVLNIENYESILDTTNRSLSVSFTLNTIYGPTQIEVNNYANY
jgi:hypothetical protein